MIQNKTFLIYKEYKPHNSSVVNDNRNQSTPVYISTYAYLEIKLEHIIMNGDYEILREILASDFIYPEIACYQRAIPCSNNEGYWIETYAVHRVTTVLEELLINHRDKFMSLYRQLPIAGKQALMDFTARDMNHVDLTALDFRYAVLDECNLKDNTTLTEDMLAAAISYEGAVLPEGMASIWSEAKKMAILREIAKLEQYGELLKQSIDEEGNKKGHLAVQLARDLRLTIMLPRSFSIRFQRAFIQKLHEHDDSFNHKRYWGFKQIIANIVCCIAGLGVGYLCAGWLNYRNNGCFFFFNQTTSQKLISGIDETAYKENSLFP